MNEKSMIRKAKMSAWRDVAARNSAAIAARVEVAEAVAAALHRKSSSAASWDPYHVWLTRVQQPREQRAVAAILKPTNG